MSMNQTLVLLGTDWIVISVNKNAIWQWTRQSQPCTKMLTENNLILFEYMFALKFSPNHKIKCNKCKLLKLDRIYNKILSLGLFDLNKFLVYYLDRLTVHKQSQNVKCVCYLYLIMMFYLGHGWLNELGNWIT